MEVEIKFEKEGRSGIIPVGTYLFEAARRMGVKLDGGAVGDEENPDFAVQIVKGKELLSDFTKLETEQLSEASRKNGERLARQTKIEKPGEVVVMTKEKVQEEKEETKAKQEEFRKEFEKLPLEKKIANLVELEAIALSDTFSFILNSPYKIGEKFLDVLAEFGMKFEREAKDAATPKEHQKKEAETNAKAEAESQADNADKSKQTRKPRPKKTPNE